MPEPRKKADWPIVTALVAAVVLVPLAVYIGGYFALKETKGPPYEALSGKMCLIRFYRAQWQRSIYKPAANIESLLTGRSVATD